MKKIARYSIRIAGALLCLLLLAWLGLAAYVQLNKADLLQKTRTQLGSRLSGDVRIGGLDISFFRHWPSVAVTLSDVTLRDSAWQQHHHDLLKAADIDITFDLLKSLLTFRIQPGRVVIEHGQAYFYTDSSGYSNTRILRSRDAGKPGASSDIPDITLIDMRWVLEKQDKRKLFDFDIRRLDCAIEKEDRVLRFNVSAGSIRVVSFAFNTENGSFMKDKMLSGHFAVQYNTASKIVQFNKAIVKIGGQPFVLSGRFFPTLSPDPFFLTLEADHILFRQATALLTPKLQQKIDQFDIDKPVSVQAQLDAGAADDPTPQIQVHLDLHDGSVVTPAGRFTNVSFKGSFINEFAHGQKRADENSGIRLLAFSGRLQDLPLHSDTITIVNLKHPQLSCDLHSHFALQQLNELTGSQTMQFSGGTGILNLFYKGPLSENDTAGTVVNGSLDIDSAALTYLPYKFSLTGGAGRLLFKDQDLVIDRLSIHVGSSKVQVSGIARNLVALLDRNAENVSMDWTLSTPHLQLEDLMPLAGRSATPATSSGRNSGTLFQASFSRIDRLLKEGAIHVGIDAAELHFRKFSGGHAKADLLFDNHAIRLNRLTIEQGSGSLELKAMLNRQTPGETIPLTLESHLDQVDLTRMFTAFNDFGQDALVAKNLRGKLTADVRMSCELTGKARIVSNSLKGTVDFTIRDGQLVDFAPMEKIQVSVLKDRDLSAIKFAELQNELDVDSTTLNIHRMEINSTAFTMYAQGTYDLKTGPDISLQIPFSSLSKDRNQQIPPESQGNGSKGGLSIWLRARRGADGKPKISWDPFKKALKKGKHK